MEETIARRKRINRLKKIILGAIGMAIFVPFVICIILAVKIHDLNGQIKELNALLVMKETEETEELTSAFTTSYVEESKREQEIKILEDGEEDTEQFERKVYLTFDDGPSSNTGEILDILKQYNVKATFFVLGKTDEQSRALYRRIVEEGHTLGMHSYSHKYEEIYASKENFIKDLTDLQEYLYEVTGVWPRFYRFPGGSSNEVSHVEMQKLIAYLNDNDIVYFDWNVASGDAVSGQLPKETIVHNCTAGLSSQTESVILLHDTAQKDSTVAALPEIISQVRMRGDACFLPITENTTPVQHKKINR